VRSGTGTPIRVAAYSIHPPAKIPAASDNVFPFYCFLKWLHHFGFRKKTYLDQIFSAASDFQAKYKTVSFGLGFVQIQMQQLVLGPY